MTTIIEYYISDKLRKNTLKSLSAYFPDKKNCLKVETGCYDFTEQYCKCNGNNLCMAQAIYTDTVKNIIFNCEQNHLTMGKIRKLISKGQYNAYNLAFLSPHELDEDNWMKIILRKNTTEEKLTKLPTIQWRPCRVCKNTGYFFYQLQTRSADEPMTTFYICKECNRTYKVNN